MAVIKMQDIISFSGKLRILESGLHIGGTEQITGIGETDNPIIRNPITRLPYVPGSSIKGKIRSLLESKYSPDSQSTGKPCTCGECKVCLLFGCGDAKKTKSPTRLVFRDSYPDQETLDKWSSADTDSELKTEVLMDRRTGSAFHRIGPRTTERVPADSSFDFSFSLRIFEGDDVNELLNFLAGGFEFLEKDYIGGSGSRGYGHVAIYAEDAETHMHDYLRNYTG